VFTMAEMRNHQTHRYLTQALEAKKGPRGRRPPGSTG